MSAWRAEALCATCDPELWFPMGNDRAQTRIVKRICSDCPVQGQCLTEAISTGQEYGIWGGATGEERRRLRRRLSPPKTTGSHSPCGTSAGYAYHLRHDTPPCDRCREAQRQYRAKQRSNK